ncbi:ATP-binding protein [Mucilaginibacter sp. McL0603]|uniref:ATP-binding protein n=1 Tax=Mucilaginibacter sp. McL0603 TaxID=3415670 RepID=UPI003CF2AD6C
MNHLLPLMLEDAAANLPDDLFRILFEKSPGSLLIKADAPRFTILAASDAYLNITSVQRRDVLGKGFFEVFPENGDQPNDDTTARKVFTKVIETNQKLDVPVYRYDVLDPVTHQKQIRYWSCSNTPILDDGKVDFILNTVIDVTAEVKAKEAAIESENRLLLAAEATGMAIWDLDIKATNFTFSPQFPAIFGHSAEDNVTLTDVQGQVHPDDLENVAIKAYYESIVTGTYFYEIRIYWPDNSLHWIRTKGTVLFNKDKEPIRMLGTIVDITESKRDEIRKSDFIAMASHELKTPLTSLKAYLQLLESKLNGLSDPFIKTAVVKCGNQVNKMTALIHSFLDISKLEPGKLQLKREIFNINKLINDIINESRILSNTHVLIFDNPDELSVNADREKIGQVIGNFISNAIKYSAKGSEVFLHCEVLENDILVSVKDEGIGIRLKDREKVFQRFYRAEDEDMRNVTGFGIGLYLSSEIIQRHKGEIWVKSEEGKGSTFYFSLPLNTD